MIPICPKPSIGGIRSLGVVWLVLSLVACSDNNNNNATAAAPTAQDDGTYRVTPGQTLNVNADDGVLANDTLPGEQQSLTVPTGPSFARSGFVLNADGSFRYPHENSGAPSRRDSFVYEWTDTNGQTARATVSITATTAPLARPDNVVLDSVECELITVTSNDSDGDSDPLSVVSATTPFPQGTVRLVGGGVVEYCPSNTQDAQFDYTIDDGFGARATSTVFVSITADANPDVVAFNDTFTVARGGTLTVAAPGVRLNDEIDGESAIENTNNRTELVPGRAPRQHDTRPAPNGGGTFVLNSDGGFSYVHDGSDEVIDTFDYFLFEGTGANARQSSAATVSIQVLNSATNDPPDAANDVVRVNPNASVDVPVLYNDTDREDDVPAYVAITSPPVCGTVDDSFIQRQGTVAPPNNLGVVRYTHDATLTNCNLQDDIQQTDSFSYRVADSNGATDQATVTVMVTTTASQAPSAADDELSTPADQIVRINPLINDNDPDGDPVILELADGLDADDINGCDGGAVDPDDECITQRASGTVGFVPETGVITYVPASTDVIAPPYSDVFEYKVNDGRGAIARASITINVRAAADNRAPIVCDDPIDTITTEDPPSGCIDVQPGEDRFGTPILLYTVPACTAHELALNVLINDTDLDPEDRPPYRFRNPADEDPNPPRHISHAPADAMRGVGALRITEAPSVTGTGSPGDIDNGRRSRVRISDDGRFLYYQHVGADSTFCEPSDFVDTFTIVVEDGRGGSDEGIVQVTVDADRIDLSAAPSSPIFDSDGDAVPNGEDQCANSTPPTGGAQADAASTIFSNGCNLLPSSTPVLSSSGMGSIDPDGDGIRGTDDNCPTMANPDQDPADACLDADQDGVPDTEDDCPDELEDGVDDGFMIPGVLPDPDDGCAA